VRRLRAAQERPRPRSDLWQSAERLGVRCAIDVSDGLVQDLGHIATASRKHIRIEAARVPVSAALRAAFPERAQSMALAGGEDYELVLIASRPVMDALAAAHPDAVSEIGSVVAGEARVAVVDESGSEIAVDRGGWDHFGAA
jgi:thiamine-monophosphate kinase